MRISSSHLIRLIVLLFVAFFLIAIPITRADNVLEPQSYASDIQNAKTAIANQDYSAAFNSYLLANLSDSAQPAATIGSLTVLEQNTPSSIDLSTIVKLPTSGLPFNVIFQNTEAGSAHSDYKTVFIVPNDELTNDQEDPVDNWPFSRAAYVYTTRSGLKANLLCTVYYQTTDYSDLAHHIGALLALLDDVYYQKMFVSRADDSYPFNVWLCSTAPVSNGGEQWQNNIYFYDIGDDRSSIEWIREIAHEFSHLAFRAVGGQYTFPEAFANGYLGERLLVRWLSRGAAGGAPSVEAAWTRTFGGYPNFERLLINPALKEFTSHGLNKTELAQKDGTGMRYMIGMMLYLDDVCGSAAVGSALQSIADQHSSDPDLLFEPVKAALSKVDKSAQAHHGTGHVKSAPSKG